MVEVGENSGVNQSTQAVIVGNQQNGDPLYLSASDHPGMVLVTVAFIGGNYLHWSRNIRMAFGAKNKLGSINGTVKRPTDENTGLQWERCDYMVRCWILNTMNTTISNNFTFANSAAELWGQLRETYVQSAGPLLYRLKKEMSKTYQNDAPVAEYYSKLKMIWDEIDAVEGFPECTCGVLAGCSCGILKKLVDADNRTLQKKTPISVGINL